MIILKLFPGLLTEQKENYQVHRNDPVFTSNLLLFSVSRTTLDKFDLIHLQENVTRPNLQHEERQHALSLHRGKDSSRQKRQKCASKMIM